MNIQIKTLILSAAIMALAVVAQAQTNQVPDLLPSLPKPVQVAANYLSANTNAMAATNWTGFAAYSRVSGGANKNGGTFGAVYYLNPYIGTQIRIQYIDTGKTKWFLPNGTITLQSAYKPFNSLPITLRPLVELGVAVDFEGNMMAIAGAGSELDLWVSSNPNTAVQRISCFYGTEQWQGSGLKLSVQQFGGAVNMNLGSIIGNVDTWFSSLASKL